MEERSGEDTGRDSVGHPARPVRAGIDLAPALQLHGSARGRHRSLRGGRRQFPHVGQRMVERPRLRPALGAGIAGALLQQGVVPASRSRPGQTAGDLVAVAASCAKDRRALRGHQGFWFESRRALRAVQEVHGIRVG